MEGIGELEYWSIGVMENLCNLFFACFITPLLQLLKKFGGETDDKKNRE
jgi:hypothetical protein